jgi:hypothetical protein
VFISKAVDASDSLNGLRFQIKIFRSEYHGGDEFFDPDRGVYVVGVKSYGRAPTFLLRTGSEQACSIVAAMAGDSDSARQVELVLPETGVCSLPPATAGVEKNDRDVSACCGAASERVLMVDAA